MDSMQVILSVALILFLVYKYGVKNYSHWKKRGVKQTNPPLPFLGDNYLSFFRLADPIKTIKCMYEPFKNERYGGVYAMNQPLLLIRDPELIKQIMIKDAEFFTSRVNWFNSIDPIMDRSLLLLEGEEWRNMRTVLTTVFTAAKMKDMFTFMSKCSEQSTDYLKAELKEQTIKSSGPKVLEIDFKDYFSRYCSDVIASTAFGIEINSFKDRENEFYKAGQAITEGFRGWRLFKLFFMMIFPTVAKALKLTFFGKKLNNFMISTVTENIQERERRKIIRKDVIHILMEARKGKVDFEGGHEVVTQGKLPDLTNIDIAAQAMLFFFGGFESLSSLSAFLCYELALNPEVQQNLVDEINEIAGDEDKITYEGVMQRMRYLDMVVNETLRKWPPAMSTDRKVTKPYTIPKTESSPELELLKGDAILINIAALHYDPEYFPNPEKFDPERFRDEKNTIKPFTFLPFGAGLRHCVGMRYALMQIKVGVVNLLREFEIVPTKETQIPIRAMKTTGFILRPEKGFRFGLKLRNLSK